MEGEISDVFFIIFEERKNEREKERQNKFDL